MTRATDTLARVLARLGPRGPQPSGKPPKRKAAPESHAPRHRLAYGFRGLLSPARCGSVQTQTRSMRLDTETDTDIAAALAAVRDPLTFGLVVWVALPGWRLDVRRLENSLYWLTVDRALNRGWSEIARPNPDDVRRLILGESLEHLPRAVLAELSSADACSKCVGACGKVIDKDAKPKPAWVTCPACLGSGRTHTGIRKRAKALHMRYATYRTHQARSAYEWLLAECNDKLQGAVTAIRAARSDEE